MTEFDPRSVLILPSLLLLLTLLPGMLRVLRGPTLQDRMLSVLLLGTGGVALLLMLAFVMARPALVDVALVLALLAVMAAVALTRRSLPDD